LSSGELQKSNLESLREELSGLPRDLEKYFPEGDYLSELDKKTITSLSRLVLGGDEVSIAPMICKGPACPLVRDESRSKDPDAPRNLTNCVCPLYSISREPEGFPCPIESMSADKLAYDVCNVEDFDASHPVHRHLVQELVNLMIVLKRAILQFNLNGDVLGEKVTIKGQQKHIEKVISPYIEAIQTIQGMIDKKRDELNATPKAKIKADSQKAQTRANVAHAAEVLKRIVDAREDERSLRDKSIIVAEVLENEING